jgi:hypothetical protein
MERVLRVQVVEILLLEQRLYLLLMAVGVEDLVRAD